MAFHHCRRRRQDVDRLRSYDDTGATDAGAAYLFDAVTGQLLQTFLNPTPDAGDRFGVGMLPPQRQSGHWGSLDDDAGAVDAGAVYVFDIVQTATTDSLGNYSFAGLDAGSYTVREVVQPGFAQTSPSGDGTYAVSLTDGQQVTGLDFGNTQPTKFYVVDDATVNKTFEYRLNASLAESYRINNPGNTAPRGAASTAAGDKVWVVDANKKVYVYNTTGGLLGSWTLGSLSTKATVQGIATNGTDVWVVDSYADKVYKYTGAASRDDRATRTLRPVSRSNSAATRTPRTS